MLIRMLKVLGLSTVLYFSAAPAQWVARGERGIAPPEGSSVERLGDSMVVNGRPMTIDHVTVQRSPADVLRHYRRALTENASGKVVESKVAGDQILARKIGENFVTIRVRSAPSGGSDVWVMTTAMQPPPANNALPAHLALPAGAQLLSNVETVDGGRRAYTVIATAEAAVPATQDFLKRSLGERGFTLVASDASRNDPSRRVLLFQRGAEDVMITIADGPAGRTIVLNASAPK
ncbi:MAG TPA: hypothetical protein VJU53_13325 [Burkholderiaceae bacterium]|nr:hypothetical protein [Burkholderiaceae bacterium]